MYGYNSRISPNLTNGFFTYFDFQLNEMLEEKMRPYIQNMDNDVLSKPIVLQSQKQEQKVYLVFPFHRLLLFTFWVLII